MEAKPYELAYDGMIVIVIGLLRTMLSGLYRHWRARVYMESVTRKEI